MANGVTVTCPYCRQILVLRVTITVAAEPAPLEFGGSDDFRVWLRASRLTLSEFQQLPIYQAQPERFDPLIATLATAEAGTNDPSGESGAVASRETPTESSH